VRNGASDGPDLHVNLLDGSTSALQFDVDPAEFFGSFLGVLPEDEPFDGAQQASQIAFPARTPHDAGPQLAKYGNTNADAVTLVSLSYRSVAHAIAISLKILRDSSVQ
jgi:hypothetical protein